jgi:hypothetical protein
VAFTTISVTATYLQANNVTPATGEVTFIATGSMRDTDTNVTIAPTEQKVTLNGSGQIQVNLTATNGVFTVPTGVTYEVTERIDGAGENKYFISIDRNAVGGTVNLADLVGNTNPFTTVNYATTEYVNSLSTNAAAISFTPTAEILSTNVQAAIAEVRAISKFVFTQASASSTWTVTHNLRFYPNVTVVDSGENLVVGDVQYVSINSLTLSFTSPFAGKAYLS